MAGDARLLAGLGAALVLALSAASASGSAPAPSRLEIAHWNGTKWTRVRAPPVNGRLQAVTAISANDAWAVGDAGGRPLSLHWNGSAWRRVPVPGDGLLAAVSATSSKDVWAVGYRKRRPLIEHWNGKRWAIVRRPAGAGYLRDVSALSPADVWAVGSQGSRTLVLHWNGKYLAPEVSPNLPPLRHGNALFAVASAGPVEAWAVGAHGTGRGPAPLAEHWDGRRWHIATLPTWPGATCCTNGLEAVTAVGTEGVWAAGDFTNVHSAFVPFVDRWNGSSWQRLRVGAAIRSGFVSGIAAVSPTDVWLVATRPR